MRDPRDLNETIRSPRSRPEERDSNGAGKRWSEIPPRVWAFAIVAAILLFALFGLWGLYLFPGRLGAQAPTPTAIIWTPTASPTPAASPTPTPTDPVPTEDAEGATPTAATDITIGGYVEVTGTGGYGLSLREGPGANAARADIAADGEVFIVVEGPQTVAGSPWWKIRDPENEARTWWAVGNYLHPIDHP